jgi:putative membrane protein
LLSVHLLNDIFRLACAAGLEPEPIRHDRDPAMRVLTGYLAGLPEFLSWFAMAVAMTGVFMLVYAQVTPWREVRLIREGNAAAALSFAGTLTGYVLVLCSVMRHAVSRTDMLSWGLVGLAVQFLALVAARLLLGPGLRERMERGDLATGIVMAGLGLAFGLLNAATMAPDGSSAAGGP